MSTVGTSLPAHPMFGNLQSKLRQVRNLTSFVGGNAFDLSQILATASADIGIMEDGILGHLGEGEGTPLMSLLSAWLACGFGPQGDRFSESIAGGRLATVLAILAESVFEFFDTCVQGNYMRIQSFDMCAESLDLFLKGRNEGKDNVWSLI